MIMQEKKKSALAFNTEISSSNSRYSLYYPRIISIFVTTTFCKYININQGKKDAQVFFQTFSKS